METGTQPDGDEGMGLLRPRRQPARGGSKNLRIAAVLVTVVAFAGSASMLLDSKSSRTALTANDLEEGDLHFQVENEYSLKYGPAGKDYPWMQSDRRYLVEPFRDTTLSLSADGKSKVKTPVKFIGP